MRPNVAVFLDLRRASEEYPLSKRKFQELIKEGRLPAFKIDGKFIVKRGDIEQLLTQHPVSVDQVKETG